LKNLRMDTISFIDKLVQIHRDILTSKGMGIVDFVDYIQEEDNKLLNDIE
jgi:hypothetical protein